MTSTRRAHLPPRVLPTLCGTAHLALAVAFGVVAADPRGVAGFSYHPRMLAIVHLVTLGWLTASILGSLYLVGPIALRMWIPVTRLDYTAFALVLIGIVGMVAHFWTRGYGGNGVVGPGPKPKPVPGAGHSVLPAANCVLVSIPMVQMPEG
ncbi:MAG TPA: hypothetical protein VM818_15180 [Vicinamibacterales bacterium]|nr:hypothetical protein [Vicinamibacterales bacterium]